MANAQFTSVLDAETIDFYYGNDSQNLKSHNAGKATFLDDESNNKITLEGTDFTYDGKTITGGQVDSITFRNEEGLEFATLTNVDANASRLGDLLQDKSVEAMLRVLFKGEDEFTGSAAADKLFAGAGSDVIDAKAGKDFISGEGGNDQLTGGGGSDIFVFLYGDDKDVVTDFDAQGGGNRQDYIGVESMEGVRIRAAGEDTVINLGDGQILTLEGVDRADISDADFHIL